MIPFGQTITIEPNQWKAFRFDDLTVCIAHQDEEWRYKSWLGDAPEITGDEGPVSDLHEDIDWIRWDCAPSDRQIKLVPSFPELPLIAKPRGQISIPSGGSALFNIGIPIHVGLEAECEGTFIEIGNLASQVLSKTWHGNQLAGKPCYALRTHARRKVQNYDAYAFDIICQLNVQNTSGETTQFERIYFETGHLGIFEKDKQLWTNACRIKINSVGESFSSIVYGDRPMDPAKDATAVKPPALGKARKSVLHGAFSSFIDVIHSGGGDDS